MSRQQTTIKTTIYKNDISTKPISSVPVIIEVITETGYEYKIATWDSSIEDDLWADNSNNAFYRDGNVNSWQYIVPSNL